MEYSSFADFCARAGYEIDGIWYPRVTAIVSIKAKPGLYRYYAGLSGMREAEEMKERSAQEGTQVHSAIEALLKGEHPEVSEAIRPSVEAFQEFSRNNDVRPLMVEERVVHPRHRYAGTLDAVAEINGVVGVLDIKTSRSVYREYGMQTAAYMAAVRENPSLPQPTTAWILRLDQASACGLCGASLRQKGGAFRVTKRKKGCLHQWEAAQGIFEFKEMEGYERDLTAFLAAKQLWEWEHAVYLKRLPYSTPSRATPGW